MKRIYRLDKIKSIANDWMVPIYSTPEPKRHPIEMNEASVREEEKKLCENK